MQFISITDYVKKCNITGTIYSIYHWAHVPESEDAYWSGFG